MKYEPLRAHLEELSDATQQVTLKFQEIEEIIEASLPKSASTYREWWANERDYHSQAASWQRAGFQVEGVDLRRRLVRFRRGML